MDVTRDGRRLRLIGMITHTGVMDDETTYRNYSGELTRYATTLVGPFDAADVVTDACLRAFGSKGWGAVENRRAYLYRTVLRVATDHHRSTLARRIREMKTASPETVSSPEIDLDVLLAVNRLSVQQRAAVFLTYWADLPLDDVATRMGVTEGAVKKHLNRARRRLGEWLS